MLRRWRDRIAGEAGLGIILAIQFVTIFVVAPLAATASASFQLIEMLRFGLAATTILIVARRRIVRVIVGIAFAATLAASMQWRIGEPASVVSAIKLAITLGFDCVVAGTVAFTAFGPGRVTVYRILGAVILYLYVALIFTNIFRLATLAVYPAFDGLPDDPRARFAGAALFQPGRAHHQRRQRDHRGASARAQPHQPGGGDRPALPRDPAGAAGDAARLRKRAGKRGVAAGELIGPFVSSEVETPHAGRKHVLRPRSGRTDASVYSAATGTPWSAPAPGASTATIHTANPPSASAQPTHPVDVQPYPAAIASPPSHGPSALAVLNAE